MKKINDGNLKEVKNEIYSLRTFVIRGTDGKYISYSKNDDGWDEHKDMDSTQIPIIKLNTTNKD